MLALIPNFLPCTAAAAFACAFVIASDLLPARAQNVELESLPPRIDDIRYGLPFDLPEERAEQKEDNGRRDIPKVIGGRDAKRGEFKWQVALIGADAPESDPFGKFFCGGSLIGWRTVLTAAHCTFRKVKHKGEDKHVPTAADQVHVYLGSHDFTGGERIAVREIVRHAAYDHHTMEHDLAILVLDREPANREEIALVKLPTKDDDSRQASLRTTVLGWGSTTRGVIPEHERESVRILKYADNLQFQDSNACNRHYIEEKRAYHIDVLKAKREPDRMIRVLVDRWYPRDARLITENMFCAGLPNGSADACFGDSGGPLVVGRRNAMQIGVVSWGPNKACGITGLYGVYVDLVRYLDWIHDARERAEK